MAHVLVVDDEKGLRDTFRQFLERENHHVDTAEDAEVALRKLDDHEFDVVVADIIMPKTSGVELLQSISDASPEIKVILITGEPTVETAAKAVRSGAFDYLVKPVSRDALWKVVAHASIIRSLERENQEYRERLENLVEESTREVEESQERLRRTIGGIIQAMAMTIEMRDPYTAGHQKRVTKLAVAIGREMDLSHDRLKGLEMAGIIHDLGKISIPAEILSKPGRISEAAHDLIKAHPQVGYEILIPIEFPWPLAEIVYQHQERMDGSGYPRGLPGEDILLEARILAVADVVEAVASHRPYRPALGLERALREIVENKGRFYDRQAVDACMKVFTRDDFQFDDDDHSGPDEWIHLL